MSKNLEILVERIQANAVLPTRAHDNDTGLDVTPIAIDKRLSNRRFRLATGLKVKPPEGYYLDFPPRSSIDKKEASIGNSFGVIDADYRGELLISVVLDNPMQDIGDLLGEPLCQLVLRKLHIAKVVEVDSLDDETERGEGGFGHTDTKVTSNEI